MGPDIYITSPTVCNQMGIHPCREAQSEQEAERTDRSIDRGTDLGVTMVRESQSRMAGHLSPEEEPCEVKDERAIVASGQNMCKGTEVGGRETRKLARG